MVIPVEAAEILVLTEVIHHQSGVLTVPSILSASPIPVCLWSSQPTPLRMFLPVISLVSVQLQQWLLNRGLWLDARFTGYPPPGQYGPGGHWVPEGPYGQAVAAMRGQPPMQGQPWGYMGPPGACCQLCGCCKLSRVALQLPVKELCWYVDPMLPGNLVLASECIWIVWQVPDRPPEDINTDTLRLSLHGHQQKQLPRQCFHNLVRASQCHYDAVILSSAN